MKLSIIISLLLMTSGCQKSSISPRLSLSGLDKDVAALQILTRQVMYNISLSGSDLHELSDGYITEQETKTLGHNMGLPTDQVIRWFAAVNNVIYRINAKEITDIRFGDASLASCQAAAEGMLIAKCGGVGGITAMIGASVSGIGVFFVGLVLTGALIQYAGEMHDCLEKYPDGMVEPGINQDDHSLILLIKPIIDEYVPV